MKMFRTDPGVISQIGETNFPISLGQLPVKTVLGLEVNPVLWKNVSKGSKFKLLKYSELILRLKGANEG